MSLSKAGFALFTISVIFTGIQNSFSQDDAKENEFPNAAENHLCFKCHGHKTYHYYNEVTQHEIKDRMNPYFVFDSVTFYQSNHKYLQCTDCHSYEFKKFPHSGELRMEEKPKCLDCHGGDEAYAKYHFEQIEEEFLKSVHSTKHSEEFTCSMCHNPHTYKITARTSENLKETIIYDNNICLSCHANIDKYQLISDKQNPNILQKHEWLPNQALHFANVRCIECHAEKNDSILVAHNIQPKEKAVKACVECHSQNSILMASLYKFQAKERRNSLGFFNAAILNNSYIIGANRNFYLNIVSIGLFVLVFAGVIIHGLLRFIKNRK